MLHDETIANIERTQRHLRATDPNYDDAPPIVASPKWFVDELKRLIPDKMVEPTDEIESIGELKLVIKDDIKEPVVISGGGATYPVLPAWARGANVAATKS